MTPHWRGVALLAATLGAAVQAQTAAEPQSVTVTGRRMTEELPPDKPVTVLGAEAIERRMSDNVFDILKGVPGVGVEGGPRSTGMKFSLRGFSDNDDVLFKIDGAVKGFEKYRFGSGVLLDPDLVQSLSVERGPSITQGSGALGGTISARTKSAIDLLRPGEPWGVLAKLGFNANNRERLRMAAVYGRPGDFDLLAAVVRRDSQDIRLADGSTLPVSATHSESRLAKVGWFPHPRFTAELGYISYQSGPERQPYDVTGGLPGVGGVVRRTLDDATTTFSFNWTSPYGFELRGLLSREQTHLDDEHRNYDEQGNPEGRICVNTLPAGSAAAVARCNDRWRYDISNGELFATTRFRPPAGPQAELTVGVQAEDNRRDTSRISSNATLNANVYPGGFNPNQPPGDKRSSALIAEARISWGDFALVPGLRRDRYTVSSRGQARLNMEAAGQDPDIDFGKTLGALALTWRPAQGAWSVTGRMNQGFRAPLIDEYFGDGSGLSVGLASRCRRTTGDFNQAGTPVTADTIQPLYDPAGLGRPYDPALDHAPANGICGDLYRPQDSLTREMVLAWRPARLGAWQTSARLNVYRIRTEHLLSSLRYVNGAVGQPGVAWRRGVELEAEVSGALLFASLSHGRVRRRASDDSSNGQPAADSFDVPADVTVLTLGTRIGEQASAGVRLRHLAERRAYVSSDTASQCIRDVGADGTALQTASTLAEVFGQWQINRTFMLRAGVDNLFNREYCLVSSFSGAVGFRAPGRSARVAVTAQF